MIIQHTIYQNEKPKCCENKTKEINEKLLEKFGTQFREKKRNQITVLLNSIWIK